MGVSAANSQKFLIKQLPIIRLIVDLIKDGNRCEKSSMTYWKTEERKKDDPPID